MTGARPMTQNEIRQAEDLSPSTETIEEAIERRTKSVSAKDYEIDAAKASVNAILDLLAEKCDCDGVLIFAVNNELFERGEGHHIFGVQRMTPASLHLVTKKIRAQILESMGLSEVLDD